MPRYRVSINVVYPVVVEISAPNPSEAREISARLAPIRHPQVDTLSLLNHGWWVVSVGEPFNMIEPPPIGVVEVEDE
jgi:hypothetical protein